MNILYEIMVTRFAKGSATSYPNTCRTHALKKKSRVKGHHNHFFSVIDTVLVVSKSLSHKKGEGGGKGSGEGGKEEEEDGGGGREENRGVRRRKGEGKQKRRGRGKEEEDIYP